MELMKRNKYCLEAITEVSHHASNDYLERVYLKNIDKLISDIKINKKLNLKNYDITLAVA